MTGPTTIKDELREAAEKAAATMLERPFDLVVAGSFAFMPGSSSKAHLFELRWVELWPGGPKPPDMRNFRSSYGEPTWADCAREMLTADVYAQAPAIRDFINRWRAEEQRLRALFA